MSLVLWYLLREPLVVVYSHVADRMLPVIGFETARVVPRPKSIDVTFELDRKPVTIQLTGARYSLSANSVVFLGLLLSLSFGLVRVRWKYLTCATLVLFLCQVTVFVVYLLSAMLSVFESQGQELTSPNLTHALDVFCESYIAVSAALPFLLFVPVFVTRTKAKSAPEKVSRNAPCPCGSGRKFKHCCGGQSPGK